MKMAHKHEAKHLSPLTSALIGVDHIAFSMPRYEMTFRDYLMKHREPRHLNKIFMMIISGLRELHNNGFVHRDLKPENIMVNLRPIYACIIDFERATPRTQGTRGTSLGTPGYQPVNCQLKDGSTLWDVYALAAMILEADMYPGEYFEVKNERGT
jgi:serine/threonine protein kinase